MHEVFANRRVLNDRQSDLFVKFYENESFRLHSRDEKAMLVYKTMAKCRSSFAQ